jgi:diguanylate cyclase (GGDEF)-like protein
MTSAKSESINPKMMQRITTWLGLLALLAFAALSATVYQIAREIDHEAMEKDRKAIDNAVGLLNSKWIADTTSYYYNDESYLTFVREPNLADQRSALIADETRDPAKAHTSIVAPNGVVTFSTRTAGEDRSAEARDLVALSADAISELRELHAKTIFPDGKGGFRYDLKGADTIDDDTGNADLAIVEGRPAIVVVSAILPDDAALLTSREPTVAIDVTFLDDNAYDILAEVAHVAAIRPAKEGGTDPLHVLKNSDGEAVASVSWSFDAPGQRIIKGAGLVFFAAFTLFLGAVAIAAVTLRRLVRRLAEGEAAAIHAARHDGATGLANRGWTTTSLARFEDEAEHSKAPFCVALIDLDYFKAINDTLGHAAGDAVILAVAERLRGLGSALRLAGRLGGDEFIAVSPGLEPESNSGAWAEKVRLALMQPVMFGSSRIEVSASIGAALHAGGTVTESMKHADLAMYRAKRDGRGCIRHYDPALDAPDLGAQSSIGQLRAMAEKLRPDPGKTAGQATAEDAAAAA